MPELTRCRSLDHRNECWHVYYGDVHVGTIVIRSGNPHDTDPWEWRCGFYPGSHPGEHQSGTAMTFDQARADFEVAWKIFLSKRTEGDFQEWRNQRALTAWKYAMWAAGLRLPTQQPGGQSQCLCGAIITIRSAERHVITAQRDEMRAMRRGICYKWRGVRRVTPNLVLGAIGSDRLLSGRETGQRRP
jgi:hypothetical protein